MKTCKDCGIEKEFDQFRKAAKSADGYANTCIECKDAQKTDLSTEAKLVSLRDSTNEALNGVNERISGLEGGIQEILKAMQGPAMVRKSFEAAEKELGTEETPEFYTDKNDNVCIKPRAGQNVNDPEFKAKNDMEMFMREMVRVKIHHASDKNADPVFMVGVNGKYEYFARGQEKTVMRMFIEGLARAKPVHYSNVQKEDMRGIQYYQQNPSIQLRYPFSTIQDTERGNKWLERILAET